MLLNNWRGIQNLQNNIQFALGHMLSCRHLDSASKKFPSREISTTDGELETPGPDPLAGIMIYTDKFIVLFSITSAVLGLHDFSVTL